MAKGKKTAALLGALGAGAVASKQIPYLGKVDLNAAPKEARPDPVVSDEARKAARKKVYETEPSLRGTLMTEDYQPVLSGTGLSIKSGMKKGGTVSASRRADGIAKKGKTKGRML
jgi:hypothetical protein